MVYIVIACPVIAHGVLIGSLPFPCLCIPENIQIACFAIYMYIMNLCTIVSEALSLVYWQGNSKFHTNYLNPLVLSIMVSVPSFTHHIFQWSIFFVFLVIIICCFDVAIFDLVHNVKAIYIVNDNS